MAEHILQLEDPRPYFAEVAYYIWGQVNYDSEGDCVRPTDRDWSWLYLKHRETGVSLDIKHVGDSWRVRGSDPEAARAAHFLCVHCGVTPLASVSDALGDWDHVRALARSKRVAEEFARPELNPFDNHDFWGSWKWIGWYASEFTWVGRWIMYSVCHGDVRAVPLCIRWLKHGTCSERQSVALRYALARLSGAEFVSDQEWVRWYEGDASVEGYKSAFPQPNIHEWLADLKGQYPGE